MNMHVKIYQALSFLMQFIAILLLLVAFIVILYPYVLLGGSILAFVVLVLLISWPWQRELQNRPELRHTLKPLKERGANWMRYTMQLSGSRRLVRSLAITLLAMLGSIGFYGALKAHSWFFYIKPMDRELEPFRQVFRSGSKTMLKLPETRNEEL